MAKGVLSGVLWGLVVAALGLAIASQITPLPERTAVEPGAATGEVAEPAATQATDAADGDRTSAANPGDAPAPEAPRVVDAATDAPSDYAARLIADAGAVRAPESLLTAAGTASADPAAGAVGSSTSTAADDEKSADAAVPTNTSLGDTGALPPVAADPATLVAATDAGPTIGIAAAPAPADVLPAPPAAAPSGAMPVATAGPSAPPEAAAEAPTLTDPGDPTAIATSPATDIADTSPPLTAAPSPPPADATSVPVSAPDRSLFPDVPPPALPRLAQADAAPAPSTDAPAALPGPPDAQEARVPVPGLVRVAPLPSPGIQADPDTVVTGRLPTTGTDAAVTTEPASEAAGVAADPSPRVRHARPFENPGARPTFAILLVDTGGPAIDRQALAGLPFPVSFAIDPQAPDAATAAAIYRDAGQEVLMLATGIPEGASAADLEVTFQAHAAALPQAVAVLDLQTAGFQDDRPLATQVVPVIAGQGRGLVTWDRGLNAADQVARRSGLPSATIFRSLDAEGEPADAIRRYLDRAVFKAAQDGRVVVVGTTRPETVAALLEWSIEGRAATVALAPVTAVLAAP